MFVLCGGLIWSDNYQISPIHRNDSKTVSQPVEETLPRPTETQQRHNEAFDALRSYCRKHHETKEGTCSILEHLDRIQSALEGGKEVNTMVIEAEETMWILDAVNEQDDLQCEE